MVLLGVSPYGLTGRDGESIIIPTGRYGLNLVDFDIESDLKKQEK